MCPDHGRQACERAGSQRNPPLENQSYRDRTTGEPDHVDNSFWRLKSQPSKSPERLATTDKTTAGAKYKDPCYRRAAPQLPTPSDKQAVENRLTKEPDRGEQTFEGTCLQLTQLLEDQTPKGLKPRSNCSRQARIQLPTLCEDKCPKGPDHKEPDCQRARPQELGLSEDHVIWDRTLAEHGGPDLWKTKPPKGQTPSGESSADRASNEYRHEGWKNQRTGLWRPRPPDKLSPTGSDHTGEDHWKGRLWKTGPPG